MLIEWRDTLITIFEPVCEKTNNLASDRMRGSRNFHERGSNENGNFWSQMRGGGPTPHPPKKIPKLPFLGKIFKFQGGSGPPVPPSGSAHGPDPTQTGLYSHRRWLEAGNFGFRK